MAFDFAAGLAAAGEAVGKTAQFAALEQQKSGLEAERLKLANDLAMTRESAGRKEAAALQSAENVRHEGFLSEEGAKNRAAQLEAHRISAGASAASAAAHLQGVREQIAAMERAPEYKVSDDGTLFMIPKKVGADGQVKATPVLDSDGNPQKVSNPEKLRAQSDLIALSKQELTNTARMFETDLKQAQAEVTAALKTPGAMTDPDKDPGLIAAKKAVEDVRKKYEPQIQMQSRRIEQLYKEFGAKAGIDATAQTPATAPPLGSIIKLPGAAPANPTPAPTGLINGGPM